MRIAGISDTHTWHYIITNDIPEARVLVFAGDCTSTGDLWDLNEFCMWMAQFEHEYKIFVAGNHDRCFTDERRKYALNILKRWNIIYLEDDFITVEGFKIYGSPWKPTWKGRAMGFTLMRRSLELAEKWALIPNDIDVLITHTPPYDILDYGYGRVGNGCEILGRKILGFPQLKAHIFGHIHEGYGIIDKKFYNVSICTREPRPENRPTLIEVFK